MHIRREAAADYPRGFARSPSTQYQTQREARRNSVNSLWVVKSLDRRRISNLDHNKVNSSHAPSVCCSTVRELFGKLPEQVCWHISNLREAQLSAGVQQVPMAGKECG